MNSKTKSLNKRILIPALGLLVVGIGVFVLEITNTTHLLHTPPKTDKQVQTEQATANKKAFVEQQSNSTDTSGSGTSATKPQPASSDYTPPTTSNGITIDAQQSNEQVVITTKLSGYSDGTCTLQISNASKATTLSAKVIYQPQFSTCAGFSVPTSTLGSGTWTINLSVLSAGITTSKATTLSVK